MQAGGAEWPNAAALFLCCYARALQVIELESQGVENVTVVSQNTDLNQSVEELETLLKEKEEVTWGTNRNSISRTVACCGVCRDIACPACDKISRVLMCDGILHVVACDRASCVLAFDRTLHVRAYEGPHMSCV